MSEAPVSLGHSASERPLTGNLHTRSERQQVAHLGATIRDRLR